jgi:hypothetical protein
MTAPSPNRAEASGLFLQVKTGRNTTNYNQSLASGFPNKP